jgi:hypothetical protein
MNREPIEQNVSNKPKSTEGVVGDVVHVVADDGNYYGSYRKTLVGLDRQELWMPCDQFGNIF